MPRHANALPQGTIHAPDELPHFFCLFEDDNLVTKLSIHTEQLLEPNVAASEVDLVPRVRTRVTRPSMSNGLFG
jgi:hypothetical protein